MKQIEEKIWNTITDSAKRKFDYSSFKKDFPFDPDNVIFKVIVGLVNKKEKEELIAELHIEMLMTGFIWKKNDIEKFIDGKESLFKTEIFATQLAFDMLQKGNAPLIVLNSISQIL